MPGSRTTNRLPIRTWARAVCALAAAWAAVVADPAVTASQPVSAQAPSVAADAGTDYVALGSSFAAGPGHPARPVERRRRRLCPLGHQLPQPRGPRDRRRPDGCVVQRRHDPARAEELPGLPSAAGPGRDPERAWCTVTIGGNDVNYLGSMDASSQASGGSNCPAVDRESIERTFPELPAASGRSCARSTPWRPRPACTWSPTSRCCRTPAHAPSHP